MTFLQDNRRPTCQHTRLGPRAVFIASALLFTFSPIRGAQQPAEGRRPNIIVIVSDDVGYGDIGAYGSTDIPTPHLDSLASNGVRFTDSYVTAPVCGPSRAGLLTGRYQQRFGFEFNVGHSERSMNEGLGLPDSEVILARVLREAGYATGMVGKWHLGMDPRFHPMNRGFDEYFGFLSGLHSYVDPEMSGARTVRGTPYLDMRSPENSDVLNPLYRAATAECHDEEYLTDVFSREAVDFIERHKSEPFFLYLAYNALHTPLQATRKLYDEFGHIANENRRVYAGMQRALDNGVGQILKTLDELGLIRDTLVVFVNDNGGALRTGASRNTPLKGGKHYLFEGGIRVAMMMQWPGRIPTGAVYTNPVTALDVFPTSLAAASVPLPAGRELDGVDLVPYLTGQREDQPHQFLFWRYGSQNAVRHGNWKLFKAGDKVTRLYDLSQDIGSEHNLAALRGDVVRELSAALAAWDAELSPPQWNVPRTSAIVDDGEVIDTGG